MELLGITEMLVKSLSSAPDMVKVQAFENDDDDNIILEVMVPNEDMGIVIGRGGKNINAIRVLVQAAAYTKKLGRVTINVESF